MTPADRGKGGLYIVVKFPEEDDAVAIIHKNWIDGNGCMWPPQTKYIKSLLKAGAMPGNDWRNLPCEVVEAFANYHDAVRALRKAEDNSDIASASERGRGKRKKKRRLYSDEDEMPLPQPPQSMQKRATHGIAERSARMEPSSISTVSQHSAYNERMHGTAKRSGKESLHSWNVPQCSAYNERMHGSPECSAREPLQRSFPRRPECDDNAQSDLPGLWPCVNRTATPSSGHYDCRSQPFEHEHLAASQPRNDFSRSGSYGLSRASFPTADVLSTPTSRPTSRSVSTINGPSDFEHQVFKILQTILMRVEHQGRQLDAIAQQLRSGPLTVGPAKDVVPKPFEDIEAFEEFDAEISTNEGTRTRLVQQFHGLGGSSIGPATRRILGILLSQKVAVQYSWLGKKGKKSFSALQVADTITRAVMQNFPTSKRNDVESIIKVWLRHSGEKLRKQQAKAATSESSLDVNSDFSD
ncbi:uncharacterized protein [Dermacentor andersoni]|uniref:uncharacterized protein isoform X2 n=1 Tax=Dermacentor andersoni TaxID=34620 RepID=UPI002415BA23|nr:uncharacterized protein LOC126539910 isoform X2 [Dermacentor andersoni]